MTHAWKFDAEFDELVGAVRVPLADLVEKVIAANGDQAIIDAWIDAAAKGLARCYWDGMHNAVDHALDTGVAVEQFRRMRPGGMPQ